MSEDRCYAFESYVAFDHGNAEEAVEVLQEGLRHYVSKVLGFTIPRPDMPMVVAALKITLSTMQGMLDTAEKEMADEMYQKFKDGAALIRIPGFVKRGEPDADTH